MAVRKGKVHKKGKGKYLKYRNGPGATRPQRTGKNKQSGPDTGSHEVQKVNLKQKIVRFSKMVANHRDPTFALRRLVPKHLVGKVAEVLPFMGVEVGGEKK